MDVKAAYLNADLDEEIYMEAPPGFDIPEGHVLRLKKCYHRDGNPTKSRLRAT